MKIIIQAPAKINLFLRVLDKREDGYYNIKSGITFINLFDEISIAESNKTLINYSGTFRPFSGTYKDCVIKRTLEFLNLYKRINLQISVKKNIPVQAGLGSASTNAATLIKGLKKLNIIQEIKNYDYSFLSADIPVFLFGKNSLVQGMGQNITKQTFPKYFFLLVKPKINLSTKMMYEKINMKPSRKIFKKDDDWGNDFENIAVEEYKEIKDVLKFIRNIENCIFARMTGSGSCCFGVFAKAVEANQARKNFKRKYPKLWSFVGENNTINN